MFLDEGIYKKIMEYSIIPAVDVLFIKNNHEVLLGLRDNRPLKWVYYFPWGRIEKWETIMQAVKRKMYEEIWYKIDTERLMLLNIYDDIFDESIYENITLQNITITYVYLLDDKMNNIKPADSQHNEMKFFDINDKNLHDRVKIRIKDLLDSNIIDNGN